MTMSISPSASVSRASCLEDGDLAALVVDDDGHRGGTADRMAGHVRERFLDDAVAGEADRRVDELDASPQVGIDVDTGEEEVVDQGGHVEEVGGGQDLDRIVVLVTQQPDRSTDLGEALPAGLLSLNQGLLGLVRVLVHEVAGSGDVEHDDGERMADQVVDITGDAPAFVECGLVGDE